uniref:Cytochrome c oxidase subunit NDUFA4 n=1 Tax=Chelydra serpentina TaxID=8475 RepID=A0A8C3SC81_CHESE
MTLGLTAGYRDETFLRGRVRVWQSARPPHPTVTMFRLMISQAKKHPSLIPLFIFIGAGGSGAALYIMRLAMFNPDVCWDKKNNPEPWNKLAPTDQYKPSVPLWSQDWGPIWQ